MWIGKTFWIRQGAYAIQGFASVFIPAISGELFKCDGIATGSGL